MSFGGCYCRQAKELLTLLPAEFAHVVEGSCVVTYAEGAKTTDAVVAVERAGGGVVGSNDMPDAGEVEAKEDGDGLDAACVFVALAGVLQVAGVVDVSLPLFGFVVVCACVQGAPSQARSVGPLAAVGVGGEGGLEGCPGRIAGLVRAFSLALARGQGENKR